MEISLNNLAETLLYQHTDFRRLLSSNCFYFLFLAGKKIVSSKVLLMHKALV